MKIIADNGITECSLSEYIRTLDLDQAEFAKNAAQERMDRILAQKKVKLIRISDGWVVERYFPMDQYEQAVTFMAAHAISKARKGDVDRIELDFCSMFEEEAKDTLENWNPKL